MPPSLKVLSRLAGLVFATLPLAAMASAARVPSPVPLIVTYELGRARGAEALAARDPRAFWTNQILGRIEAVLRSLPRAPAQPLTVELSFTIDRSGRLATNSIRRSSGNDEIDRAAQAMLIRAQPFPPMPAALREASLSFVLPLRFR